MCVSPLKILSRKSVQVAGLTPQYNIVPCGKCWQCQQQKRDGFTVRSIFEFMKAKQNGGFALFLTLTYNDSNLRVFHGVPMFLKDDVQKYLKKVRINLVRFYERKLCNKDYAKSLVSNHVTYLCSSENGDKRHRPHYHIMFFCDNPKINPWIFRKISISSWSLGFCVPSQENYGFVTDTRACKYVAKYVGKSMLGNEYFAKCFKTYEDRCKKFEKQYNYYIKLKNSGVDDRSIIEIDNLLPRYSRLIEYYNSITVKLKENSPFMLCSKGFGSFALDNKCSCQYRLTNEMFVEGKMFAPDSQLGVKEYRIPDYYKRKLFYNVSSEVVPKYRRVKYSINQIGIDVKTASFKKYFDNYDKNVTSLLSINFPDSVLESSLATSLACTDKFVLQRYVEDVVKTQEFKEFALLYTDYSQYLDSSELPAGSPPSPYDVYEFRQYVDSDTTTSIDYDSVNDYLEFYLSVLSRLVELRSNNPFFVDVFYLIEDVRNSYNEILTVQHKTAEKVYNDNLLLFKD